MAQVIARVNRPTLVIVHNKTLAAQLFQEFRRFFPDNAVEYFVSYYDYYQPEAYVPASDTYIEKEATINDEIDRMRLSATRSLFERRDVIIVASVSCIYGLGSPEAYYGMMLPLEVGQRIEREQILRKLVDIQYERNDVEFGRGTFRVRGDIVEVFPAYEEQAVRIELFGDEVDELVVFDPLTGRTLEPPRADRDLPEVALRHAARAHAAGDRLDQGRARRAPLAARGRGEAARGAAPAPAHDVRPRDDARDRLLPRDRELLAPPDRPRAGRAAADAARLLAGRRPGVRRREPPDRAADPRDVPRRPVAQGDAGRATGSACRRRSTTGRSTSRSGRRARTRSSSSRPRPGPFELRAVRRRRRRADHPADRPDRPAHRGPAGQGAGRRPARRDPRARGRGASACW